MLDPVSLEGLLQSDLADQTNRLVLADAMHELGRVLDEKLCRAIRLPIQALSGRIVPQLVIRYVQDEEQFFNCFTLGMEWGRFAIGITQAVDTGKPHDAIYEHVGLNGDRVKVTMKRLLRLFQEDVLVSEGEEEDMKIRLSMAMRALAREWMDENARYLLSRQ